MTAAPASNASPAAPAALDPAIEPFDAFMLDVDGGHRLYVEQCGRPDGVPVVVLHGGPGSGASPLQRRFFDATRFRIVLFDQRGCGRSTPAGRIEANDTPALVRDIECIRQRLGIARWLVFGGSWGASLALAYAGDHPQRCAGLILRGTFLTGHADLDWFFGGAAALAPVAWQRLRRAAWPGTAAPDDGVSLHDSAPAGRTLRDATPPHQTPHDTASPELPPDGAGAGIALMHALAGRVHGAHPHEAVAAWSAWESALSQPGTTTSIERLDPAAAMPLSAATDATIAKYRVQAHYLVHECFLGQQRLLAIARGLGAMPVQIVHGRLDWVCRPVNAWAVHRAAAGSTLRWVDHAAHDPYHPDMVRALHASIRAVCGD